MRTGNLIGIALRSLALNKFRALLTMLGIIIGVASVITMLAIGEGSRNSIRKEISSMGTNMITIRPGADARGGVRMEMSASQTLTLSDYKRLCQEATLLTNVSPLVMGGGQVISGSENWPTNMYGVSPEYLSVRILEVKEGSMFGESAIRSNAKVAVIGQTVVENLFPNGENPLGKMVRFNNIPFKVIGILAEKGENTFGQDQDDIILAPYTTVQKRILATDHLQSVVASARSEADAPAAVEEITGLLRQYHRLGEKDENDFNVFSMEELISTFSATSQMLTVLLVAIAGISLFIGGIGIMNIMYVSVKERTREIGLRLAVGARGRDILLQFLIESVLISVTGGIIGVLLGLGATYLIANAAGWPVSITLYSIVISFVVCVLTGVFFGWYPARKAAAMDPIAALRYE